MYTYYNCNPCKKEVNDCVVRAIALAQNRSWDKVYSELTKLAQSNCTLLDDVHFVEPYLDNLYTKACFKKSNNRMTVEDFITENNIGTYLITMNGHITCAINGIVYDIWDCRNNKIWCAWKVI